MSQHQESVHLSLLSVLAATDERWSNALYLLGTSFPRSIWKVFEYSGDGILWLAIALAAFLRTSASRTQRTLVLNFLTGWVIDLALVGSLKALVRRRRPVYNQVQDFVVVVAVDAHSFPSGHAARVSFIAQFMAIYLAANHPWVALLSAVWAVCTALSRAAMGRHYLSDVLAGLLVGVGTTAILSKGEFAADTMLLSRAQTKAVELLIPQWLSGGVDKG